MQTNIHLMLNGEFNLNIDFTNKKIYGCFKNWSGYFLQRLKAKAMRV